MHKADFAASTCTLNAVVNVEGEQKGYCCLLLVPPRKVYDGIKLMRSSMIDQIVLLLAMMISTILDKMRSMAVSLKVVCYAPVKRDQR